jgi:hypothetical protein
VGHWGPGLYSSDIAADMRDALKGLLRVPMPVDEIVAAAEREIAPLDDEVAVVRLVAADVLERAGWLSEAVRAEGLAAIASGDDIAGCAEAGISAADLRKRRAVLSSLAERLRSPRAARPRPVLKAPDRLLFEPGDVLSYPIRDGACYNPYLGRRPADWMPDGHAIAAVVATGHALGWLGWYAVVSPPPQDPAAPGSVVPPGPAGFGSLTPEHASRIGLARIARQPVAGLVLSTGDEGLERGGRHAAILSISLANVLPSPGPADFADPGET